MPRSGSQLVLDTWHPAPCSLASILTNPRQRTQFASRGHCPLGIHHKKGCRDTTPTDTLMITILNLDHPPSCNPSRRLGWCHTMIPSRLIRCRLRTLEQGGGFGVRQRGRLGYCWYPVGFGCCQVSGSTHDHNQLRSSQMIICDLVLAMPL